MDKLSNADLITLLIVLVFGAVGTYLLLPHSLGKTKSKIAHWIGLGLSVLAVLALSRFWKVGDLELISKLFFYLFGFMAVMCAVLTITSRDPVQSALWFAAVVLATSGLFLLAGAQFLAAGTVIVYAGAIIVTFLFVIMLAQKEGRAIYDRMARAPFLATLSSFLLLAGLMVALLGLKPQESSTDNKPSTGNLHTLISLADRLQPADPSATPKVAESKHHIVLDRSMTSRAMLPEMIRGKVQPAHVASLGSALFTDHLLTIEVAGTLLFVALIGALAIATPKPPIRPIPGSHSAPASKIP